MFNALCVISQQILPFRGNPARDCFSLCKCWLASVHTSGLLICFESREGGGGRVSGAVVGLNGIILLRK